ncbi:MAG: class I SAM-dependent methyltransferase, partial [Bacteroidota bacterium]
MNFIKSITRLLLGSKRKEKIATRLLGGNFYILKRMHPSGGELTIEQLRALPPHKRSIQNILSVLPHVQDGYRATDWFWSDSYYPYYVMAAKLLQPRSIVEIGSLQGFSLVSMAEGHPETKSLQWVDNETYLANSNQMCYENVRYFFRNFHASEKIPEMKFYKSSWDLLRLKGTLIDLVHIDGEHSYEGKLRDLAVCSILKPSCILLDDYFSTVNHEAIDYWAHCHRLDFFVVDTLNRGMAVFDFGKNKAIHEFYKEVQRSKRISKIRAWHNPDV